MLEENKINGIDRINDSKMERAISALAGSLLLYYTIKKHKGNMLLALTGGCLLYRGISGHWPMQSLKNRGILPAGKNINVRTSVIVNRPRQEVYAFWRRLENLPLFMKHLEMVREIDEKRSAWTIKLPGDIGLLQWDAEIVREEDGSELSWHSLPGAPIGNAGKINFTDTPARATRIDAMITYRAPFGLAGEGVSRLLTPLFREQVREDILGFKRCLENKNLEAVF